VKRVAIILIKVYRKFISPMFGTSKCKFTPTCSSYAIEALEKYGFIKGSLLSIRRILRCNPFSKGGFDPVP